MFYPKGTVQSLGPEDGVAFVAQRMMVLIPGSGAIYTLCFLRSYY